MDFFEVIFGNGRWVYLWHGLEVTLVLTTLSVSFGLLLGLVLSLMSTSTMQPFKFLKTLRSYKKSKITRFFTNANPIRFFAKTYIAIIRGTPVLVQLLIMYYVIFGSFRTVPKLIIASIAFALNSGAYIAEIIRGGIESVDEGQLEASRSLGFTRTESMFYIVLPQAMRSSLPSLIGEGIAMFKETSIVGWIGLGDIMRGADDIRSLTATAFESLFAAAIMYFIITMTFSRVMSKVEKHFSRDRNNT